MVTSVAAAAQSLGIVNMATGTFVGDGAITDVLLGFIPRRVSLINLTDRIEQTWVEGMAGTHTLNRAADGVGTDNTGGLITQKGAAAADTFQGFRIAAAAAVNAKNYHWTAWG